MAANPAQVCAIAVAACLPAAAAGPQTDTIPSLDTLTVIGTRALRAFADAPRSVTVVGPEQLAASSGLSLQQILESVAAVDVRERGEQGMQADLAMRGSSFEQVLVMVDGMPIADPQTGHHLMDIPLTAEEVERIEVLTGQASRLYGPSAVGGVVNIVTRTPAATGIRLSATAGQRGILGGRANAEYLADALALRVGASHAVSDGYRHNSDTDLRTVSCRAGVRVGQTRVDAFLGHVDKEFGANGFYSDRYPNQREHTTAMLAMLGGRSQVGPVTIMPRISWRRHTDDYVLDFEAPELYRNVTYTNVLGGGLQGSLDWKLGTLSAAADAYWDHIRSDDLELHHRYRAGLHVEQVFDLWRRLTLTPGVAVYFTTGQGWKAWPGMDLAVAVVPWLRLYAGVDYSFRVPTFTELYTGSPSNAGDTSLAPERALSYEAGARFSPGPVRGSVCVYRREGRDVIDWVRATGQRQWMAGNVDEVNAIGAETQWQVRLASRFARRPALLEAGYAFVHTERDPGALRERYEDRLPDTMTLDPAVSLEYKYGTDYLRHKLTIGFDHALLMTIRANWRLRYEVRNGETDGGAVLADARVYYNGEKLGFYVEADNVFGTPHRDFGSVPGAPRTLLAGIELGLAARGETGSRSR